MKPNLPFTPSHRGLALGALTMALVAVWGACADQPVGTFTDRSGPSVTLVGRAAPTATSIAFDASIVDNLGVRSLRIVISGSANLVIDTIFTQNSTAITVPYTIELPGNVAPGSPVTLTATATDGARNPSAPATLILTVGNTTPPIVSLATPRSTDAAVLGRQVLVTVNGNSVLKVRSLGYVLSGIMTGADSVVFSNPLKEQQTAIDTLTIAATTAGALTITPFLIDSLARLRFLGTPVTIQVQTAAGSNTKPTVNFGITSRIESTDTINVSASDPAGVAILGYDVRRLDGTLIVRDSVTSIGTITALSRTLKLNLPVTTFPTQVLVRAFAQNSVGGRDSARVGSTVRVDTVTVVAGVTRALPLGGQVADAIYHTGVDKLYLTNITRNQLDVFYLADSSFKAPIIVGSRPWGLAAWPRDRNGAMGDTIIVANSGGTSLSYVRVAAGAAASGAEVYRYPLPNIIVYTITSKLAEETGQPIQVRTRYDFSDRPQWVAATCRGSIVPGSPCGDVLAVYSTTPTGGQSKPFEGQNGTVRYENLTKRQSHFIWEHASGQGDRRADTLEIERLAAQGVGSDSLLVPFRQPLSDGSFASFIVQIKSLAFRDTTFIRNSGNFRRAMIGEGGNVINSRVMMYDATRGMRTTYFGLALPTPVEDAGVSRALDVTDYIANTSARVSGVGINYDGELGAIRADSGYLVDPTLRLQGLLAFTGKSPGFDFHPRNAGLNSTPLSTRLAFSASSQPEIEVFDTYCFQRVTAVPVRDPIIGPIKASLRASGELVLVGATIRGVVIVSLPNTFTTTCP